MATTRKQMYLEKINDSSFSAPVPVTVEEELLDGMSGGSGGGNVLITEVKGTGFNRWMDITGAQLRQAIEDGKTIIARMTTTYDFTGALVSDLFIFRKDFMTDGTTSFYGAKSMSYNDDDEQIAIYYAYTNDADSNLQVTLRSQYNNAYETAYNAIVGNGNE